MDIYPINAGDGRSTEELVEAYIKSQWANYRRAIYHPQAREELLAGASLYSFAKGTTEHISTYQDKERTTLNTNPVIFYSNGHLPPVTLHLDGCDLGIIGANGEVIASRKDVPPESLL